MVQILNMKKIIIGLIIGLGFITLTASAASVIFPYQGGTGIGTYTTGDILYSNATNVLTKLGIGSVNEVLTIAGGVPTWAAGGAGSGDVESVGDCTDGACLDGSDDGGSYIRIYDGDSNYAELNVGNIASDYIVYLPTSTGTLIHTETDPLSSTKALDNLTGVAINTSLLPASDSAIDLGSSTPKYFANAYIDKIYLDADSTIEAADVDAWITGVAYDDIEDPDASGSITMGAYTGTYTSATDGWGGMIIENTTIDLTSDTILLTLQYKDDNDPNGFYLKLIDDSGDTPDTHLSIGNTGNLITTGAIEIGDETHDAITVNAVSKAIQLGVHGADTANEYVSYMDRASNTYSPTFAIARARGDHGTFAAVADDDILGQIGFMGYDGTDWGIGAQIRAVVDGTPGDNDLPTELIFRTTIDGATTPTTALTLDCSQNATFTGTVTGVGSFIIGSADMNETDLEKLDGITNGTAVANKALVLDGSLDIATINSLTATTLVGALTGNADTVTNATFTTALTVDTGTLTLTADAGNDSILTIGGGAVSVSGANTGDQDLSGKANIDQTMYIGTTAVAINRGTGTLNLAGIGTLGVGAITSSGTLALGANNLTMTGSLGADGSELTKGWFTDLDVTNAIAGSITGNAATVTGFTPAGGSLTLAGADAVTITTTGVTNSTLPLGTKTLVATDIATLSSLTSIGTIGAGTWEGTAIADAYIATSANWNTAYDHSQDNTQAHSDYLLNSGDDAVGGNIDFGTYKAIAMTCDNGATVPASPVAGQWFLHTPTGRKVLMMYDGSNWIPIISVGAFTVYVDNTDGTDAMDKGGAADAGAFATIQYAIDRIPGLVGGNVIININNENYSESIEIKGKNVTGSYTIVFQGVLALQETATSATVVAGTGATQGTVTKAGQFTGDSYANLLAYFVTDDEYRLIDSHTDDVLTLVGTAPSSTAQNVAIYDWGTVMTGNQLVTGTQRAVWFNEIEFTAVSGYTLTSHMGAYVRVNNCHITGASSRTAANANATMEFYTCVTDRSFNALTFSYLNLFRCKSDNDGAGSPGVLVGTKSVAYLRYGTIIDMHSAANSVGLQVYRNSWAYFLHQAGAAGTGYERVRNCVTGVKAYTGGIVEGTVVNVYTNNTADEDPQLPATSASYGYID